MIQSKTILICFLSALAVYLILRLGLLMQYLTVSQAVVAGLAVLAAAIDCRRRGCRLRRLSAPREDKDLRLFLMGKNLAFAAAAVFATLCALSLVPGSRYHWNSEAKIEIPGLPVAVNQRQIRVMDQLIAQYEDCATVEQLTAFRAQMRQEKAVPLWAATLGYTRNHALQRELIAALETETGLTLRPAGELTPEAIAGIVKKVLDRQAASAARTGGPSH